MAQSETDDKYILTISNNTFSTQWKINLADIKIGEIPLEWIPIKETVLT